MKSKEDLIDLLDKNILNLREKSDHVLWGNAYDDYKSLVEEVVKLKKELMELSDDDSWVSKESNVYELEAKINKFLGFKSLLPNILNIYLLSIFVVLAVMYFDVPSLITSTFGIEAPEKILSYSIGGALIYFTSTLLSEKDTGSFSRLIVVRVVLAVSVPIILVSLIFDEKGAIKELTASPELISFLCGYSAKLVIDFLSKLVDKGQKMIEAI
ncbi:TPA: hypothetical protein ACGUP9_004339 [Vibrio vulnificus]|uniref:Uncharacterized protein n=1 Tax=Vibrio coralliilyticus TaxID=190893 RepID=A0AAP6ZVX6_9VIBR|nr:MULTISPECIES: hypothetical protein [Vibrio]NOJ26357.1 hypothetical protein [Vibrio coralliilyticus]WIL72911.1 hypothetical protein QPX65_07910 [Vibrio vulnificus]HAS6046127.1 hypothetical protein [Vibrio vulnificus]